MSNATDIGTKKTEREQVAVKTYLDSAGKECGIEKAVALQYKSVPTKEFPNQGKSVTIPFASYDPEVLRMLAAFGTATLATNTASFNRNSAKDEDRFPDDAEAVEERFGRLEPDNWGNKGGGGFGIDLETLADAVYKATGNAAFAAASPERAAKIALWTNDAALRRQFRNHKDVAPIYEDLMRAKRKTEDRPIDDLLAAMA